MAPVNKKKIRDQEIIDIIEVFKRRVKLIKEGKIVPVLFYDDQTYDSLKSMLKTDKSVAFMLGDNYKPGGTAAIENKKFFPSSVKSSPSPKKDTEKSSPNPLAKLDDSEVVDVFKKRVKLVKEGKITPTMKWDEFAFDDLKSAFGGMKGAVEKIRQEYPRGIYLTENKKSSPSPKKDTKKDTKKPSPSTNPLAKLDDSEVVDLFKKRAKLLKEGKTSSYGTYDAFTFDDMKQMFGGMKGAVGAIRNGYPQGISLEENKKSPSPKKGAKEESVTKTIEIKGSLPKGKHVEVYLEDDNVSLRKMSDKSVRVKGTVIDSRNDRSTISYMDPRKESEKSKKGSLSPFSKAMLSNDEDNSNFEKMMEEDEEAEREQARLAAEDERRRKDRESQKKSQEKQRKDFEVDQKRIWDEFEQRQKQKEQAKVWEEFEKRQNQTKKDKTPLTPMQEIKFAGGREKFALGKTITKCSRVLTLDQVNAPTCWFNALMMVLFFSQNTRIAIASSLPYISEKWKFPIVVKISKLLEGYNKTRASKYLYERLQPKEFLETLREHYPQQFPMLTRGDKFKKNDYDDYDGDSLEYMHRMLQFLEIQHLILSRPSMKSGKTGWSHYNYDLFGNKLWGDDPSQKQFNPRHDLSSYPKFVDTKHPMILTMVIENEYDKLMTERAGTKWKRYPTHPVEGMYSDSHAPIIKYNGMKYYLDSMILSSHNSKACNVAHAIAGVTCNGDRFLYNGWSNKTVDKGLQRPDKLGKEACPLEPTEWAHTTNLCISKTCGFDKFVSKIETKEVCFSTMRNVSLIYVREDYVGSRIPSIPVAMDRMKQKQTEEGIFDNDRLIKMGMLKKDPRTGKYVVTKR